MNDKLFADLKKLEKKAIELGASATKVVRIATVKTGIWTRMKCHYGCPNYGLTLCCPPYTPDYNTMKQFLSEYEYGLIIEYTVEFEPVGAGNFQAADIKMSKELLEILLNLERDAFLLNYYRAFALKAGRCRLCKECNLKRCVHPTQARPSLEACGIDVFALANDNGFKMEVVTGPITELKVYGMLLVE